jgi:hypothetical protein
MQAQTKGREVAYGDDGLWSDLKTFKWFVARCDPRVPG